MAKTNNIGERIKALREKRGMSQGQLATLLDVNQSHISHFENGRYEPSLDLLRKLKISLKTTYAYLIDGSNRKENVPQ